MIFRASWIFLVLVALLDIFNIANCQPLLREDSAIDKSENLQLRFDDKMERYSSIVPPPVSQGAQMARFIVNNANWTSVATFSTRSEMEGYPASTLVSVSDGPLGNGNGVPYMYLTPLDFTAKDLTKNPRASIMMTLAQTSYCKDKDMDPMDPRCARVYMSGEIVKVNPESSEFEVAKESVFVRHPWLAGMPANHRFYFAKLDIRTIVVLDYFGGPKYVTVKDYFNPPTPKPTRQSLHRFNIRDENWSFESDEVKTAIRI